MIEALTIVGNDSANDSGTSNPKMAVENFRSVMTSNGKEKIYLITTLLKLSQTANLSMKNTLWLKILRSTLCLSDFLRIW